MTAAMRLSEVQQQESGVITKRMIVDNMAIPDNTLMEEQSSRRQEATDHQPGRLSGRNPLLQARFRGRTAG
jgi:hypothetical protein